MTLDKAIKNNEEHSKHHRIDPYPDYFKALQLGNEALKRLIFLRKYNHDAYDVLLPGETKDDHR